MTGQKLLAQVDDDYEIKLSRDKKKLDRYSRISQALSQVEARKAAGAGGGGGGGGSSSSSSTGGDGGEGADMFHIPAAFGRKAAKLRPVAASTKSLLDSGGYDLSTAEAVGEGEGEGAADYTRNCADDDEEHIHREQVCKCIH